MSSEPDLPELISSPALWRSTWQSLEPEALLSRLQAVPGDLSEARQVFVLIRLGRLEEAGALLAGLQTPLGDGLHSALLLHRISAEQNDALADELIGQPELVRPGQGHPTDAEGQLLRDQARGLAYRARGQASRACELLRLALRQAQSLGAPTTYLESNLTTLRQHPDERVRLLRDYLDTLLREDKPVAAAAVAEELAATALGLLDLGGVVAALRHLPPDGARAPYEVTLGYLTGNRGSPVPSAAWTHPVMRLVRACAGLEQALLRQWTFDVAGAHREALALTALMDPPDEDADAAREGFALVRARAWIILGDAEAARAELSRAGHGRHLGLLREGVALEADLLLSGEPSLDALVAEAARLEPHRWQPALAQLSRVAPNALAYAGQHLGGEWAAVTRARVETITQGLHALGLKRHRSEAEEARVGRLVEHLRAHPERALVVNSVLSARPRPKA